jgi:hypothetical protein
VDRDNFDKNETLLNVDTASNQFCLAGRVVGIDPTTTFNRRVTFTYSSLGDIKKATEKSVKGTFVDVVLTLSIEELSDPVNPEFSDTITTGCKLKGALQKEGDAAKVTLKCDVGENLSAFDGLEPLDAATQEDLIENVADAFPKRKNLKVNVKKGKIRFTHRGETAPPGLNIPLTCDLGGGNVE